MFSLGWIIGIGLVAGLAGIGIGIFYSRRAGPSQRIAELEEQLSSAEQAHEAYRQEVFGQFSDTAQKFQTLNESYVDLHQQLARSASTLCGDVAAGSLLEGSLVAALPDSSSPSQPGEPAADAGASDAPEPVEPLAATEEEIIVPERPTLDELLGPIDDEDSALAADPFASSEGIPPESDPEVREAG